MQVSSWIPGRDLILSDTTHQVQKKRECDNSKDPSPRRGIDSRHRGVDTVSARKSSRKQDQPIKPSSTPRRDTKTESEMLRETKDQRDNINKA